MSLRPRRRLVSIERAWYVCHFSLLTLLVTTSCLTCFCPHPIADRQSKKQKRHREVCLPFLAVYTVCQPQLTTPCLTCYLLGWERMRGRFRLSFMIAEVDCKLLMSMIFRNRPTTKNRKQQKPVGMLVAPPNGWAIRNNNGKIVLLRDKQW